MTQGDIIGLITSYLYAFGLLFGVEFIGQKLRWPQYLTRKLVHIGAGMWIWGILGLFDHWFYGVIPFATFIILNYIFYRYQIFKAMDATDSSPGTVYFAASITVLFALFWRTEGGIDRAPIAAAAVMAMTWGDGLASIVGQSRGQNGYTVFGHYRSWEGTIAMLTYAFLSMLLTLLLLPGSAWSPHSLVYPRAGAVGMALIGAVAATVTEGLSPAGTDNLSVPLLTGLTLYIIHGLIV